MSKITVIHTATKNRLFAKSEKASSFKAVVRSANIHLLHCWFRNILWAKLESRAKKRRKKPLLQS